MTVFDIIKVLDAEMLYEGDNKEIFTICGSDLMSDVLAFVKDHTALLTGLTNPQVIRTAEMIDISVIIFVRGKRPSDEIIQMAQERNITIMLTDHTMFNACGLLYVAGFRGEKS